MIVSELTPDSLIIDRMGIEGKIRYKNVAVKTWKLIIQLLFYCSFVFIDYYKSICYLNPNSKGNIKVAITVHTT